MATNLGPVFDGSVPPMPDISDPLNAFTGCAKRIAYKTPQFCKIKLRKLKRFVHSWCKRNLTPLAPDTDVSFDTWIESTNYSRTRKEELREAWNTIKDKDPMEVLDDVSFIKLKCFVKWEFYTGFKHPRGIFSRTDPFKTLVGPIFKQIEKQVFALPFFIKKIPVADRPRMIKEKFSGHKWFAAADFTSFEAHFTADVFDAIEFVMYKYMIQYLNCRKWFTHMLYNVIAGVNRCIFKFFNMKIKSTRQSGEMCTSLGNGFSNLMIILFMCWSKNRYLCDAFVEGDDSLVAYREKSHIPTISDYKNLGFTIKMEISDRYYDMSFCGNIFHPDDLVVLTDPIYVLSTFGWADKKYLAASPRLKRGLIRAKSLSLKFQYPGCPIITALADYGLRVTRGVRLRASIVDSMDVYHKDILVQALKIDPETPVDVPISSRILMEKVFGITIANQLLIEKCLNEKNDIEPINMPWLLDACPDDFLNMWSNYVMKDPKQVSRPSGDNENYYAKILKNHVKKVPWWFHSPQS